MGENGETSSFAPRDSGTARFLECLRVGCMFFGDYRLPDDLVKYGPARRTGFHNVSLEEAEFHWTGFKGNWVFDAIVLPRDGMRFCARRVI